MSDKIYYAKSKKGDHSQITVAQHLDAVSELASEFGKTVGLEAESGFAGRFHDFGKYSDAFQNVLLGKREHIDHAVCAAVLLWSLCKGKPSASLRAVIEAVNGHHDGLRSYGDLYNILKASYVGTPNLTTNAGKTPALNGLLEYRQAFEAFLKDHPDERFTPPKGDPSEVPSNLESMLCTRMLFSCLVDADHSISAWENDPSYFEKTAPPPLNAEKGLDQLYAYRDHIKNHSHADLEVNKLRDFVFEQCGAYGSSKPSGLFTLTAPTGTGKTLALLHFALQHTLATQKKRIIIVLPFLTLAEQTYATYQEIMPSILVDHSQSRLPEEMREFTHTWNSPFIITTSIKFFETLFANSPSDCRKLHNLAQSVVIFDEAQSLPTHLTEATLKTVNELCRRYQMTMVFSTATQPAFDAIPNMNWAPQEILPAHDILYKQLRRVNVNWNLKFRIALDTIAAQMMNQSCACGIFNLRRHARSVFEQLQKEDSESAFLLSTDLCPAHRAALLKQIHERISAKKPCRVAATQCIEAGVDLDFPILFRALAPLDSIIQAAGRCNRNGTLDAGQVTVFEPDDDVLYPDKWYQNAATLVKELLQTGELDINDPKEIRRYYVRLFSNTTDAQELASAIRTRDYEKVDKEYRLIQDKGGKIIVPYSGQIEKYEQIKVEMLEHGITPGLMKESAPLTITIYNTNGLEQYAERIFVREYDHPGKIGSGYWVLRKQFESLYTDKGGLNLPENNTNHSEDIWIC